MPAQEFLFTVDPRTDKNLSSINEQLRSLTNREDPLTLDNFISFDVIGYNGLRSVVIRVTMEVNAFYARTTFPINGAAFSETAAPQAIKLVFNSKVNEGSITDTSIKYNGTSVAASNITLESDGYTLSVDTSGLSYNALQTHTIELISLKDRKGNGLSKQDVFSYVVGTSGSATSDRGNPEPYTYHDKIGDFKVTSFVIDRYAKIADKITEYLKTNSINRDSVIAQDILNVNEHTLEVYILYFSDLFPSVIRTFPQEGALVSSDGVPTEAVITLSQPTHINITEANNITLDGIDLSASGTLSDDNRTLRVNVSGKVTAGSHFLKIENLYNELGRVRPNPPIAIGFTASDIAANTGAGGGGGAASGITGISTDGGINVDGVTNQLISIAGGDTFISTTGAADGLTIHFEDPGFITAGDIPPAVTGVSADVGTDITADTTPLVAVSGGDNYITTSGDSAAGAIVITFDETQLPSDHVGSGVFDSEGIVVSDGAGSVTITGTVNEYVSGIALTGVHIDGTVSVLPDGTGNLSITGFLTTHPTVTPVAPDSENIGNTFIQSIAFDEFGHATGAASGSVIPGSIDHGLLGGLSDNDHPQYFTTSSFNTAGIVISDGDGTITITGTLDGYVSDIAISGAQIQNTTFAMGTTGTVSITGIAQNVVQSLETDLAARATGAQFDALSGEFNTFTGDFSTEGIVISDGDGSVTITGTANNYVSGIFITGNNVITVGPIEPGTTGNLQVSHQNIPDATSVDNNGDTVVQDILTDSFGHVTGQNSYTITPPIIGALGTGDLDSGGFLRTDGTGSIDEIVATSKYYDSGTVDLISGALFSGYTGADSALSGVLQPQINTNDTDISNIYNTLDGGTGAGVLYIASGDGVSKFNNDANYWTEHSGVTNAITGLAATNNNFIQAVTSDINGHLIGIVANAITPDTIGALDTADLSSSGAVISQGDGSISITGTLDAYVSSIAITGNNISGVVIIPPGGTGNLKITGFSGGITAETDPIFSVHVASNITTTNTANWSDAYVHSTGTGVNPHGVSIGNISGGTFAQLDTAITNADLVKSGDNVSFFKNDSGYINAHPPVLGAFVGVDNVGTTVIQSISGDSLGHMTGATSLEIIPSVIGALATSQLNASGFIISYGTGAVDDAVATSNYYDSGKVDAISGAISDEIDADISAATGTLYTTTTGYINIVSGHISNEIDSDINIATGDLYTTTTGYINTVSGVLTGKIGISTGELYTTVTGYIDTVSGVLTGKIDSSTSTLYTTVTSYIDNVSGVLTGKIDQSTSQLYTTITDIGYVEGNSLLVAGSADKVLVSDGSDGIGLGQDINTYGTGSDVDQNASDILDRATGAQFDALSGSFNSHSTTANIHYLKSSIGLNDLGNVTEDNTNSGALLWNSGGTWVELDPTTSGYILATQDNALPPHWVSASDVVSGGGGVVIGSPGFLSSGVHVENAAFIPAMSPVSSINNYVGTPGTPVNITTTSNASYYSIISELVYDQAIITDLNLIISHAGSTASASFLWGSKWSAYLISVSGGVHTTGAKFFEGTSQLIAPFTESNQSFTTVTGMLFQPTGDNPYIQLVLEEIRENTTIFGQTILSLSTQGGVKSLAVEATYNVTGTAPSPAASPIGYPFASQPGNPENIYSEYVNDVSGAITTGREISVTYVNDTVDGDPTFTMGGGLNITGMSTGIAAGNVVTVGSNSYISNDIVSGATITGTVLNADYLLTPASTTDIQIADGSIPTGKLSGIGSAITANFADLATANHTHSLSNLDNDSGFLKSGDFASAGLLRAEGDGTFTVTSSVTGYIGVGTITNDQLSGNIANSKLVNSNVNVSYSASSFVSGDASVSLGGDLSISSEALTSYYTKSDVNSISSDISGQINSATSDNYTNITSYINNVSSDITGYINSVSGDLTGYINTVSGDLTGYINNVSGVLTGKINDATGALYNTITSIGYASGNDVNTISGLFTGHSGETGIHFTLQNSIDTTNNVATTPNAVYTYVDSVSGDITGYINGVSGDLTGYINTVSGDLTGYINTVSGDITGYLQNDVTTTISYTNGDTVTGSTSFNLGGTIEITGLSTGTTAGKVVAVESTDKIANSLVSGATITGVVLSSDYVLTPASTTNIELADGSIGTGKIAGAGSAITSNHTDFLKTSELDTAGLVKSINDGTISFVTDNSLNWNTAYDEYGTGSHVNTISGLFTGHSGETGIHFILRQSVTNGITDEAVSADAIYDYVDGVSGDIAGGAGSTTFISLTDTPSGIVDGTFYYGSGSNLTGFATGASNAQKFLKQGNDGYPEWANTIPDGIGGQQGLIGVDTTNIATGAQLSWDGTKFVTTTGSADLGGVNVQFLSTGGTIEYRRMYASDIFTTGFYGPGAVVFADQIRPITYSDDGVPITGSGSMGTIYSTNSTGQSYYETDYIYVGDINITNIELGAALLDMDSTVTSTYKIYAVEVEDAVTTTGLIHESEIVYSPTDDGILKFATHISTSAANLLNLKSPRIFTVFEDHNTPNGGVIDVAYGAIQALSIEVEYTLNDVVGGGGGIGSPKGSPARTIAPYYQRTLSDVYFDKTATGDQTISGSLTIPAGKTLTITKTPGSTLDAANKTYVDDLGDTKAGTGDVSSLSGAFYTHAASGTVHFTEASIDHTAITNIGSNTHATIDTHLSSKTNPHNTDIDNLGAGTLAELNAAVTDATLDNSSASRPPNGSAGGDLGGTYPNPTVDHTAISNIGSNTHAAIDLHIADMTGHTGTATTHFTEGSIDHGSIAGLGDNDHPQYTLASTFTGHTGTTTIHFTEASIDHTAITNIGTNTHAAIDTHIASGTVHFTEGSIDHTAIANIGTNSHANIDTHIADATLHFTEASIDHTNISNIGTNSHASIDTHIADATLHFTEASIDHTAISNIGTNTHAQIDTHIADGTVHFTEASITHQNIAGAGTNTHAQIDTHIADSTIHFTEGSIDHTAISNIGSNSHAAIDTHIASTANPHATDIGNLGGGTLAELNSAVTDATLDDSSASRPPNGSAGGDLGGTYPNPTVADGADGTAIHDNVAAEISSLTEKATPVSADLIIIEDSAALHSKKKVQIGNLPSGGGGGSSDLTPAEAFAWFVS